MGGFFDAHALNEQGLAKVNAVRAAFEELLTTVEAGMPASRELSLCRTKLEEACMYAVKAMASEGAYQKR